MLKNTKKQQHLFITWCPQPMINTQIKWIYNDQNHRSECYPISIKKHMALSLKNKDLSILEAKITNYHKKDDIKKALDHCLDIVSLHHHAHYFSRKLTLWEHNHLRKSMNFIFKVKNNIPKKKNNTLQIKRLKKIFNFCLNNQQSSKIHMLEKIKKETINLKHSSITTEEIYTKISNSKKEKIYTKRRINWF